MIRIEDVRKMSSQWEGPRFLIARRWPRGVVRCIPHRETGGEKKRHLAEIKWRPRLAPAAALWQWFLENPDKIDRFRRRYFTELEEKKSEWLPIAQAARKGEATLLYREIDLPQTPAHFFGEFLTTQLGKHGRVLPERPSTPGRSERGVSIPLGKAASRKAKRPLRPERA